MGYFAGGGSGKGWNLFYFILTSDEFKELFDGLSYSFIETGSRVEMNYRETSKKDVFQAYEEFFERILIGEDNLSREQLWKIERPVRTSVTDDVNKISFVGIKDEKGNPIPFKLVDPQEPVINIDPFYLFWSAEREKLSVVYMNEPGIIGLRLSFPKYITWYNQDSSDTRDTTSYESALLFETLVKRIKSVSKKAKVEWSGKLFKPNFWVSPKVLEFINRNKYLQANGLVIR
jgi:hypothetical protein